MRKIVRVPTAVLAGVLATLALAGCNLDTVQPPTHQFEWFGRFQGLSGWEHLTGEGAFLWTGGSGTITAAAALANDEPGAIRRWRLHVHSCAAGGEMVGTEDQYPGLLVGADGTASALATSVNFGVDPNAGFSVQVRLAEEPHTLIACGDLDLVAQ